MDNQHRHISGYRELTQDEIDLINEAKALEGGVLAFHRKVDQHLTNQRNEAEFSESEHERMVMAAPYRWHAIARTDIETGFMALVRSIAQPQPRGAE